VRILTSGGKVQEAFRERREDSKAELRYTPDATTLGEDEIVREGKRLRFKPGGHREIDKTVAPLKDDAKNLMSYHQEKAFGAREEPEFIQLQRSRLLNTIKIAI